MSNNDNVAIVKRLVAACEAKDYTTARSLLHDNYTLRDPQMTVESADEFIDFMKNCPFEGKVENENFISEGNKVVMIMDCVSTKPVASRLHACDVIFLENGKVRSEEMFYDTAQIPQEAKDLMEKSMKESSKKSKAG